jgi:hypothetical protein
LRAEREIERGMEKYLGAGCSIFTPAADTRAFGFVLSERGDRNDKMRIKNFEVLGGRDMH